MITTLSETSDLMKSDNYKERFLAEYYQLKIRFEKLNSIVRNYHDGNLSFKPDCPVSLFELQLSAMKEYMTVLEARAKIEQVEL